MDKKNSSTNDPSAAGKKSQQYNAPGAPKKPASGRVPEDDTIGLNEFKGPAATQIQKVFRGHLARKEVWDIRSHVKRLVGTDDWVVTRPLEDPRDGGERDSDEAVVISSAAPYPVFSEDLSSDQIRGEMGGMSIFSGGQSRSPSRSLSPDRAGSVAAGNKGSIPDPTVPHLM